MAKLDIKTNLPTVYGKEFRKAIENQLTLIKESINNYSGEADMKKEFNRLYDEALKEIRAIVLSDQSPTTNSYEIWEAKKDLKGIKHDTLALRIDSDLEQIKREAKNPDFVVTRNGTIMSDLTKKSNIRSIKKIVCIGDSVAKGLHSNKNYGQYIAEKIGATVQNLAVSGATFSTMSSNNILSQAQNVRGADLVIVQGTDDDWLTGGGIPKGGVVIGGNPDDVTTFYGAFCTIIKTIRKNNPHAKIIAMTATRQLPVTNRTAIRRRDTDKNKFGLSLEDYVNRQVIACTELDIPVFDAYHTNLIDPYSPAYRMKNMPDGLHPNEFGHEVIAYELIKNYYYFYG